MWMKSKGQNDGLQRYGGKTSVVAAGAELIGNLHFEGAVQVDGRLCGNLQAGDGLVVVSQGGEVEGEVRAPRVILHGSVIGDVHARELLELGPTARVRGSLYYGLMEMAAGAHIEGRLCPVSVQEAPLELPASLETDNS